MASGVVPQIFAILMSWMRASYSASLLEARNFIQRTYFILSPCGDVSMTPAPAPASRLEPSKCIVHDCVMSGVFCGEIKSPHQLADGHEPHDSDRRDAPDLAEQLHPGGATR